MPGRIARALLIAPLFICSSASAQPATRPAPRLQEFCRPEHDPASPRRSKLKSAEPSDEIIRLDLDSDGDPDVLETWFNGKRARWIDENDDMKPSDVRGDQSLDALQVDRDGDGYYDGPEDINIKWVDDDGDGRPDVQIFAANPRADATRVRSGTSHWMVFIDVDHDGVNGYIDWTTFEFNHANWRVPPTTSPTHTIPPPNFSPDYMGNAIFLKEHMPPGVITNPSSNWENPFAFYDFDGDGCTEMSIRFIDSARQTGGTDANPVYTFPGIVYDVYSGIDLDNDSQKGNEFDFDMSYRFFSDPDGKNGGRIDYHDRHDRHPKMKAPRWVLNAGLFRFDNWRRIDEFQYVPHDKCFDAIWNTDWGSTWIVFDEDDDDHRWERVELYYPTKNIYSTARWKNRDRDTGGLPGHSQSDTLGDRGEWDEDNSGKGQLYVGRWDGKLHLYGAESGAWIVDEGAKYWGSSPVLGDSSPERAQKVEEVVQYHDTDHDGFFDQVTYDYDGDQAIDLTISLLDYPGGDKHELVNPAKVRWQGLHELFGEISHRSFEDGLKIYRAAWKKGLTNPQIDDLAIASSTGEQYDHGYWLKEKIFRLLDQRLTGQQQDDLRRAHFTGDVDGMVRLIDSLHLEQ